MASPREEPLKHPWVWLVYVLLYGLSIPWYLAPGSAPSLWLGVPHWIVVSVLATLGVALFTVFVIARYWTDSDDEGMDRDRGRGSS
jgi:hypothetical protein